MEQKMITIPFEVELAKKIQAGEEPGKVVTRDGRNARILCWDRKTEQKFKIVSLIDLVEFEHMVFHSKNGESDRAGELYDLMLQIPEWTQFKDGDAIYLESSDDSGDTSIWLAVVKGNVCKFPDKIDIDTHITFYMDGKKKLIDFSFPIKTSIKYVRFATDEEKKKMIDILKLSTKPQAKEDLKRFFGIEKNPECEFEFLQPVLVRDGKDDCWTYGEFTFKRLGAYYINGGLGWTSCIPYTEQTKHLLGTTDNWEE